jgi:RNA recognition motif-containing protein
VIRGSMVSPVAIQGRVPAADSQEVLVHAKLNVSNLSHDVRSADLRELFARHGEVASVSVVYDAVTKRQSGFAHVVMCDEAGARECQRLLDGHAFYGRAIRVESSSRRDKPADRPAPRMWGGRVMGARGESRVQALSNLHHLFGGVPDGGS